MDIKVNYLQANTIWQAAEDELAKLGLEETLPVPIEEVLENIGVHIIPVPGLRRYADVDAYTSQDMTEIRVDDHVYNQYEYRYLFSLAHEYGHMVLHEDIYAQVQINDVDEWKAFVSNGISDADYGKMEFQANAFAGYFLVPRKHLEVSFNERLHEIQPMVEQASNAGIARDQYIELAVSRMARILQPTFHVSEGVLCRRITKDGLDNLIS